MPFQGAQEVVLAGHLYLAWSGYQLRILHAPFRRIFFLKTKDSREP